MILRATVALIALIAGTAPAVAFDCNAANHAAAYAKMDRAFKSGRLQTSPGGGGLAVLVADGLWHSMNYPQKQRFAEELTCAVAGVGKGITEMRFKSLQTGKTIGEWKLTTLNIP